MNENNNAAHIALAGVSPLELAGLRLLIEKTRGWKVVRECAGPPDALSRSLKAGAPFGLLIAALNDLETREGLDAVAELQTERPDLKILVLCGSVLEADAALCEDLGIAGYLLKYEGPAELQKAVRQILDGGNYYSLPGKSPARNSTALAERAARAERFSILTSREIKILRLTARGHTGDAMGAMLGINTRLVSNYKNNISRKAGLNKSAKPALRALMDRVL